MEKTDGYARRREILDGLTRQIMADGVNGYVRRRISLLCTVDDIPCMKWSRLNRLLTYFSGTDDARGIRQWADAGRHIKKGSRAFHIFTPMTRKEKDGESGEETEVLSGFRLTPVFRIEDTYGDELPYVTRLRSLDVDSLPLADVARKLGVEVRAAFCGHAAGSFTPSKKLITMNSGDAQVFLHELSHAVDHELGGYGKGDYALGEVVAELSSAFLGSLYGIDVDIAATREYIKGWAGAGHVAFALARATDRVEAIYRHIEKQRKTMRKEEKIMEIKRKKTSTAEIMLPFRTGQIRGRSQTFNASNGCWVKRDTSTGRFTAVKKDGRPWARIGTDSGDLPPAA